MSFPREKFDEILGLWLGKDIAWLGPEIETLFTDAHEKYVADLRGEVKGYRDQQSQPLDDMGRAYVEACDDFLALLDEPKVTLIEGDTVELKMYQRENGEDVLDTRRGKRRTAIWRSLTIQYADGKEIQGYESEAGPIGIFPQLRIKDRRE